MDQQKLQKFHNCSKHSQKKLKFIQVNQVNNNPSSNLFYCTECINEDLDFKGINYLLIEQIIQQGESNILVKWPPVNNYQLIEKLIKETQKFDKSQYVIQRITNYFNELKDELIRKIDYCQKQMINQALDLPFGKDQIIKQYQQISQISQLRSLIIESKQQSIDQSTQQKFKSFIQELEQKKDENTEKLQKLLNQSALQQQLVNYEIPNKIKEQIFTFIDQINFFKSDILINANNNIYGQSQNNNNISDKLMQLISNKSNFCSNEFLNSIKQQLDKLNIYFDKLNFENMFILGKEPIKFNLLCDQKLNNINEYINYLIEMQNNQNSLVQTQTSQIIKDITKICKSKLNFIEAENQQIIIQHFIETFPLIQNRINDQIVKEQEKFDLFDSMEGEVIEDLLLLLKEKQLIMNNQKFSETLRIKDQKQFQKYKKSDLDRVFKQFPVFDIIQKDQISILNDLEFLKGSFNDGDKRFQIKKNDLNQYEIFLDEQQYQGLQKKKHASYASCMLNMALQKDKKYIFRILLKTELQMNYFYFGLMQEKNLKVQEGHKDDFFVQFQLENNIIKYSNRQVDKYLKGNDMQINKGSVIELRIQLNEQIFQVLDYPKYDYIISLNNQNLEKLNTLENLKLFFQAYWPSQKYIIQEAIIVTDFDD